MSIKSKLMEEIEAKAKKIREKRIEAASNKTVEAAVLEFFKNAEESRILYNNEKYDIGLLAEARVALIGRLQAFDVKVKVSTEWNDSGEDANHMLRGVTIWWSQDYIKKNLCDQSL